MSNGSKLFANNSTAGDNNSTEEAYHFGISIDI